MNARDHAIKAADIMDRGGDGAREYRHVRAAEAQAHALTALALSATDPSDSADKPNAANEWSVGVQLTAKTADVIYWTGGDPARSSDPLSKLPVSDLLDLRAALMMAMAVNRHNEVPTDLSARWQALAERINGVTPYTGG
jgi:hypothetical protein